MTLAGSDTPSPAGSAAPPRPVTLRRVDPADAVELTLLTRRNRAYLRPWEPDRGDAYFTVAGQRANVGDLLDAHACDELWPGVIVVAERIVGRLTLNNILRGPLQSCFVGYWVGHEHAGRGIAGAAVAQGLDLAFGALRLHRVEASTRVDNRASQRVLERNGFTPVGIARRRVHIDGRWHDERLYERLAPWDDGRSFAPPDQPR